MYSGPLARPIWGGPGTRCKTLLATPPIQPAPAAPPPGAIADTHIITQPARQPHTPPTPPPKQPVFFAGGCMPKVFGRHPRGSHEKGHPKPDVGAKLGAAQCLAPCLGSGAAPGTGGYRYSTSSVMLCHQSQSGCKVPHRCRAHVAGWPGAAARGGQPANRGEQASHTTA